MMKNLIYAIMALVCGVCSANASERQEMACGDKNLSYCITHFDRQCSAKNYGACWVVGNLHDEQKQYSKAKKYYELVCDKANSKDSYQVELINGGFGNKLPAITAMKAACYNLASYYYDGLGVRQDFAKALQYDKKACGLGYANSCARVGGSYLLGEGTKKDFKLAKSYYEKACEMQDGLGCFGLGFMYRFGEGVAKNLSKAKELCGKACDLGNQDGCDSYKELNEKGVK